MRTRTIHPRRGIALVLVITVIGIATIAGLALLYGASMQAQVGAGRSADMLAQSTAESGINLAVYYLQHPEKAPMLTNGFYPGEANISLGITAGGSLDNLVVTNTTPGKPQYSIVATASSGTSGNKLTRTARATVYVNQKYIIKNAIAAAGDLTIPGTSSGLTSNISGDIRSDGVLSVSSGATFAGMAYADGSNVSDWKTTPKYPASAAPPYSSINIVKSMPTYKYNGQTYNANSLSGTVSGGTLQPFLPLLNPLNIWYATGAATFSGTVNIPGTVIFAGSGGTMNIKGNVTITPKPGMPAAIVSKDIQFIGAGRKLDVNGLAWVGGDVKGGSSGTLDISGALMFAGAAASFSGFNGAANVQFVSNNVDLPDLSSTDQTPQSVNIIAWGR